MKTWQRLGSALLAAVVGTAGLLALSAAPASAAGPYTSNILSSVNSARAANGLRPYALRSDLSSVAYSWSQKMAASNSLQHNPNLTTQVSNWQYVGENVGYAPDWKTVMAAFMASPAHRANILDHDFTEIGIGVVADGDRIWVTQVFRDPLRSTSTATRSTTTTTRPSTRPKATATPSRAAATGATNRSTAATPAAPPSPQQLLARRIQTTAKQQAGVPRDPVGAAVGFAAAMRSVAG